MSPRKSDVRLDSRKLRVELGTFNERANRAVGAAFEYQAPRSTARMKTEAPWTDRTGNARGALIAIARHAGTRHALLLAHGMSYGIYLELANNGRYAIVIPEIPRAADDLMRLLSKLLSALPRS